LIFLKFIGFFFICFPFGFFVFLGVGLLLLLVLCVTLLRFVLLLNLVLEEG